MEQLAELPDDQRALAMSGMDPDVLLWDWSVWGRPEQFAPPGDEWNVWLVLAGRGFGKLLAMETPIRCNTPSGWKPIGEIQAGDEIFDENGNLCRVVQAHTPEVPKKMYRFTFSDGSTLDAGEEHQWVTWTHRDRKSYGRSDSARQKVINDTSQGFPADWVNWTRTDRWGRSTGIGPKVRTTEEIVKTFTHGKRGDLNHSIPLARPLNLPKTDLPLDPRLLGLWLGDGSSATGTITHHRDDMNELLSVIKRAGFSAKVSYRKAEFPDTGSVSVYGLSKVLNSLGLLNDKRIPREYLDAAEDDRHALLSGLLDSDGTIHKTSGFVELSQTNAALAYDALELIRSLGEKPVMVQAESRLYGVRKKDRYRITWRPLVNPFGYSRKSERFKPLGAQALRNYQRMIVSVEEIEPVLSRCLTVDSPNSMYLAGNAMIPTHNTRLAAEWVREQAKYTTSGKRRFALVARTAADVRDVIVEGESGIINVSPPSEKPLYEPSKRRLTWPNGNVASLFTADEPDSLRGPQFRLHIDTPIPTPSGWKRMGDLVDGDVVFDEKGQPTTVTKAHDVALALECYRVRFSDGTFIDADAQHLWVAMTRGELDSLESASDWGISDLATPLTTKHYRSLMTYGDEFYIPAAGALQFESYGSLPMNPFEFGEKLVSGFGSQVDPILSILFERLGFDIRYPMRYTIPELYLYSEISERRQLLSGILHGASQTQKSSTVLGKTNIRGLNEKLTHNIVELARGLGLVPHFYQSKGVWFISLSIDDPVKLSSAPTAATRKILSIDPIPPAFMRCITVDSESHLYLAGNGMVPTHNTHAWGDEIAAWRQTPDAAGMTAFDNLRVGTRLGAHPQMVVTTTPKRVPLLYRLLEEAEKTKNVVVTRGSTMDNAGNLSGAYLETMLGVYEGTSLAKQELYGEMLDNVEGALWFEDMIEPHRHNTYPHGTPLRVIGVDPSVAENPRDECGIVVVGSTNERDLYKRESWVLEDASVLGAPNVWAQRVVDMARKWGCPVVAEINQGGALVRNAIQAIDPTITVLEVHSKYGKALRAEPVTLAYEQGRVHHVGYFQDLESQMYSWIPGEGRSPDRIDALVHALTALLIKPPPGFTGGRISAKSLASRKLPSFRSSSFRVR